VAGRLALIIAALFTGAAFYVSFAEQPARLGLDDRALLAQWKPAYKRRLAMQAPLAIIGFLLGIMAWWMTGRLTFVLDASQTGHGLFSGPCRQNKALIAIELNDAGPRNRALIVKWNRLHSVRTTLGALATRCTTVAIARPTASPRVGLGISRSRFRNPLRV